MAQSIVKQYQLSPTEQAKSLAKIKLDNSFSPKALSAFNFFSGEIVPYLTDYFILSDDLRTRVGLDEEYRKCYYDYSFVVFPVHKAYESFLASFLSLVFSFRVSKKKNETIGYYLKTYSDEDKKKKIAELDKRYPWKINQDKWFNRWVALGIQWVDNRNPLIHPGNQRISTFRQAEQIASSIISEMRLSIVLIMQELLNPLSEKIQKEKSKTAKLIK